jgi:hypothetical protein
MSTNRINRLIGLLMNAIKKARGVRREYLREALRCLNRARVYLAQGYEQTARYACERAVFWYELAR